MKLKQLNKFCQQALRQAAAFKRWERKEPWNRVSRAKIRNSAGQVVGFQPPVPRPEPPLNSLLEKVQYTTRQDRSGHYVKKQMEREKVQWKWICDAAAVLQDYQNARRPQPTQEAVKPLKISLEDIERMLLC